MKPNASQVLLGVFLILAGAFFLLASLTDMIVEEEMSFAVIIFTAGIVLLVAHFVFNKKLWTLILGTVGLFIGTAIFIDESRILPNDSIGLILFVLTGLIFLSSLRFGKKNWWTIIPGGFCLVIAAHILFEMYWWIPGDYHGVVLFGGAGLIFGINYLLRDDTYKLDWAKFPSIIAFVIAGIIMLALDFEDIFSRFVFPAILVGLGTIILFQALKKGNDLKSTSSDNNEENKEN